jgi:hypothetical protein
LQRLTKAAEAFLAFEVFRAQMEKQKAQVWRFILVDDNRLCETCDEFRGELYELEDPEQLYEPFPDGEFLDNGTFACNIHPNCRCTCVREEE